MTLWIAAYLVCGAVFGAAAARALALFEMPFPDLLAQAQQVHRQHHDPCEVELATLLSIKTGGCPEDCAYCPQSVHHDTGLEAGKLSSVAEVEAAARAAREAGATRFCMGAAWRELKDRDVEAVAELVGVVKSLGLESCATLGMLSAPQAQALKAAGLDYYNHNLDTSPDHYARIVGTRHYDDRLRTLQHVREAGLSVCCGGIVGMGETRVQRADFLAQLAVLDPPPESVPINHLVRVPGTPLADQPGLEPLEFVRTIAVARLLIPKARVRLSAGRREMSDELQALCFVAGANSIFYGDKLLTTGNADIEADRRLLERLGLRARTVQHVQAR